MRCGEEPEGCYGEPPFQEKAVPRIPPSKLLNGRLSAVGRTGVTARKRPIEWFWEKDAGKTFLPKKVFPTYVPLLRYC